MTFKIEPSSEGAKIITQPMVRNFSTGGGHGPGDTIIEGDRKIVTQKWQGHPPVDLTILGKPQAPLREVVEPRYRGTAEFATRVRLPGMLHVKFLRSLYPRSALRRLDTAAAEKMPGVHHIMTYRNAPRTNPLHTELMLQGEIVAIVAAETENQAEDAVEAIVVDYTDLPAVTTLASAEAADAPDIREGKGNLLRMPPNSPNHHPTASAVWRHGDVEKGFAESDIVREYTYYFGGGRIVPMQPFSGVAQWEGDKLTFWGHGQDIYPSREFLAGWLGIDKNNIHFINKWNGGTFGGFGVRTAPFWGQVAHIAKVTGRPVKAVLTKAEELYHILHKPETLSKFKVGLTKDGKITRCATNSTWWAALSTRCRNTSRAKSRRTRWNSTPLGRRIGSRCPTLTKATRRWSAATAVARSRRSSGPGRISPTNCPRPPGSIRSSSACVTWRVRATRSSPRPTGTRR